jgi:hypothetical protein
MGYLKCGFFEFIQSIIFNDLYLIKIFTRIKLKPIGGFNIMIENTKIYLFRPLNGTDYVFNLYSIINID